MEIMTASIAVPSVLFILLIAASLIMSFLCLINYCKYKDMKEKRDFLSHRITEYRAYGKALCEKTVLALKYVDSPEIDNKFRDDVRNLGMFFM